MTADAFADGCYRFRDLEAKGIVSGRTDLQRKQDTLGFPRPVKTGERQAVFIRSEVHDWLRQRAALRDKEADAPKRKQATRGR